MNAVRVELVVGCEWGFTEPPEEVDLQRIWDEAKAASGIAFYIYMEQLYKHAPRTYARLRDWRMSQKCNLVNWSYDPHGRFTPMKRTWEDIKDQLTPEFLYTLREAAKVYGHDGDWVAVRNFVRECHYIATGVSPSGDFYEPYE